MKNGDPVRLADELARELDRMIRLYDDSIKSVYNDEGASGGPGELADLAKADRSRRLLAKYRGAIARAVRS